jgi:hypothetical protein
VTDRAPARFKQQQAHRPGADQQDVLAEDRAYAAQAVNRARQRLDEGTLLVVHAVREAVRVGRRDGDVLGEGAVDGVADRVPVRAQVAAARLTRRAVPAEKRRVDRDPFPAAPFVSRAVTERDDAAGELVARNDRVRRGRELTVGDVQVGAADAARPHLHDQLAVPRHRVGDLGHLQFARLLPYHRAHCALSSFSLTASLPAATSHYSPARCRWCHRTGAGLTTHTSFARDLVKVARS